MTGIYYNELTDTECYEYVEKSKGLDTTRSNTELSYLSTHAYNKSSDQDEKLSSTQGQFNHTKNKSSVAGLEARLVLFSNFIKVSLTGISKLSYYYSI